MHRKKLLLMGAVIAVAVIILIAYSILNSKRIVSFSGNNSGAASGAVAGSKAMGTQVTVDGFLICLPHKQTGNDCMIGLESADEKNYYGLIDQNGAYISPETVTTGSRTTITGIIASDVKLQDTYTIGNVIQVQSAGGGALAH